MGAEQNKELARRVYDALNRQDNEAFAALHKKECVLHQGAEQISGLDSIVEMQWGTYFKAFPDSRFHVERIIEDDSIVGVQLTFTGTHKGELHGMAPTGKEFRISGAHFARVADGRIAEVWLYNDMLGLMQQLGTVPGPH